MDKTIGYNENTAKNLLIDAGAVWLDYNLPTERILSATSGGNEVTIDVKTRMVKVDGIKSENIKGLKYFVSGDAKMKVNLLEVTTEILKMALISADVDSDTDTNYDIITGRTEILESDYISNIALVGTISGTGVPVIVILQNVLSDGGLSMKTEDDNDNVLPVEFIAHQNPLTPKVLPYIIRYPKPSVATLLYVVGNPIVDSGEIRIDFNADVVSPVPFTGFTVLVDTVANAVTAATRNVNDLSIVNLTLTTPPTSGQVVTVAYTKSVTVEEQVTAVTGGTLATFAADTVTNN